MYNRIGIIVAGVLGAAQTVENFFWVKKGTIKWNLIAEKTK